MRPSDARAAVVRRPRSSRGRASGSPASRRRAGSMKTAQQTIVESGLPGSPKTSVSPRRPNHSGLPGLIWTRQKTSSTPTALERRLDVIVRADRHAARDDQHVALQPGRHRVPRGLEVVADHPVVDHLGSRARSEQAHHQAVGLVDPSRLGRGAERQQLAAGDDQVQPRAPVDGDLADAGRRQRGDAGKREPGAHGSQLIAGVQVLAAAADVQSGGERALGRDVSVGLDRQLGLQHRVGSPRNRGAGRDARGGPGLERGLGHLAGRHAADQPQRHARGRVGGAHRVAVHRRPVERRQVDGAHRRLRDHPPGRLGQRRAFGAQRSQLAQHEPQRLVDGDHPPTATGPLVGQKTRARVIRRSATSCGAAARTPGRSRGA